VREYIIFISAFRLNFFTDGYVLLRMHSSCKWTWHRHKLTRSSLGDRSSDVADPHESNGLLSSLRQYLSYEQFKRFFADWVCLWMSILLSSVKCWAALTTGRRPGDMHGHAVAIRLKRSSSCCLLTKHFDSRLRRSQQPWLSPWLLPDVCSIRRFDMCMNV